jgi:hypothetical protein
VELRDDTVWDGATPIATVVPSATDGGAVSLQLVAPIVISRAVATGIVSALTGARVPALAVSDELVRSAARTVGWTGPLRAPLVPPTATPIDPPIDARIETSPDGLDAAAAVAALLPGTTVERRGFGRRVLSLRATGPDGLRVKVKVPDRADVIPELLAAALDVTFAVRRRFGRMASGVHTIAIDDGAGTFDDHSTLGSAQSGTGTFFLDTSLAFVEAMDAQRQRMAGRRGVSASPSRPWFAIDGVVAHEYWHNLDTTVVATPAVYLELNRFLGAELGVDTYEHALRGREPGAPPEWQAGFQRILQEVSPYATTNWRESTAELFKLWWCRPIDGPPAPLVAAFGALLDRFYPTR